VSSLKSRWAEILVARRVEQVEGEPLVLEAQHRRDTEMPRSRSTAIQSERTRRRSPRAFTAPANCIAPPDSGNSVTATAEVSTSRQ
jgi:hypothetical protein